jgi:UDP-glucose 4-epimerase
MSQSSKVMRVLVTGGAGFIGSHVVDAFLTRGADVTVVDDLSSGRIARLDPAVELHKVSIADAARLSEIVERVQPQVICHLAAQIDVRVSVDSPAEDARINVLGTINVLEAARAVGARVLFASTGGAIYGEHAPVPSAETVQPAPEAPYGTAKYCAEQYIDLFNRLHGTRHGVLRLGNVYGPRQDPAGEAGVIAIFCGRILQDQPLTVFGDGTQTRDYVYVGDVVDAFLAAADGDRAGVWNIGTGAESTVLDLIDLLGRAADRRIEPEFAPPRAGELQRSALDNGLAERELGWRPATTIESGIAAVYQWAASGAPERAGL